MTDRLQYPFKTDHDIFIALIEDFNTSIASLDRRMIDDHTSTLEIKDLLERHYETLSQRIEKVEREMAAVNPEEIAIVKKDVERLRQWNASFNKTKHTAWIIASTGFIVLGYYLPQFILAIQKIFGVHK